MRRGAEGGTGHEGKEDKGSSLLRFTGTGTRVPVPCSRDTNVTFGALTQLRIDRDRGRVRERLGFYLSLPGSVDGRDVLVPPPLGPDTWTSSLGRSGGISGPGAFVVMVVSHAGPSPRPTYEVRRGDLVTYSWKTHFPRSPHTHKVRRTLPNGTHSGRGQEEVDKL